MAERLVDPDDPLRFLLRAAKAWHIPPTVMLRERTVDTAEWTGRDLDHVVALEMYEASLCPGGAHVLAETSRPDHADAYRRGEPVRCWYCKAAAQIAEADEKQPDTAGLLTSIVLDAEVVELNRRPVPPLPPGLRT